MLYKKRMSTVWLSQDNDIAGRDEEAERGR